MRTILKLGVSGGLMGLPLWGLETLPSVVVWILAFWLMDQVSSSFVCLPGKTGCF